MTAPKKIWATGDDKNGSWTWEPMPGEWGSGQTEYTRSDLCNPAFDVADLVAALRAMVHRAELYGGEGGIFLGNHDRENIDRARAAIAAWEGK